MKPRFTPGRRLAFALLAFLPLFALGELGCFLGTGCDAVVFALALLESRRLRGQLPELKRALPARFVLGVANAVRINLHNPHRARVTGTLRDDVPSAFRAEPDQLEFALPAAGSTELGYEVIVTHRGQYAFGDLHLRLDGALGLGSLLVQLPAAAEVRAYPNLRGPRRYQLAQRRGALHSVGVRSVRRVGGGGEFEQLREYVPADALRDVEWKATAKRLRPITRVQGMEQSQNVLIALDAGRMMASAQGELTKLDHAIHAALLLSWVALRGGDKVGLLLFAEEVRSFVPPARGHGQYLRILDSLYAAQPSASYVDFREFVRFVRTRVPRRSLLLLFSDLLDESQAVPLAAELPKLRAKHLPVCVTMRDPIAAGLAEAPVTTAEQVYLRAAAADLLAEGAVAKAQLTRAGIHVLETSSAELALATVNRYLEIKRQRLL